MTKWQVLLDAILVGGVQRRGATQRPAPLGVLGLEQMAFAGAGAQHFSCGRDLEPLGRRFLCFDAFWTSHKKESELLQKERAI